jgi:hypothetical protein
VQPTQLLQSRSKYETGGANKAPGRRALGRMAATRCKWKAGGIKPGN